ASVNAGRVETASYPRKVGSLGQFVGWNYPLLNRNKFFCFRCFGGVRCCGRDYLPVCTPIQPSYCCPHPTATGSGQSHACCRRPSERRLGLLTPAVCLSPDFYCC